MNKINYLEINKKLWDDKTEFHFKSEFYNVDAFLKGKCSLNSPELHLLGDIKHQKILHLQCHFGMDTISLSRLGGDVTGVDLSITSIKKAKELSKILGTDTKFVNSDVYSLADKMDEKFDVVFTSYGTVGWLPDTIKWAQTIHHFLKPNGKFVIVDFHPVVWMFSDDFKKIEYKYSDSKPIVEEYEGTYTDRNANIKCKSVTWNHGMAKIMGSLIECGLEIKDFQEYYYSPYNCFQNTIEIAPGKYQIKGMEDKIPMLYSILAKKS